MARDIEGVSERFAPGTSVHCPGEIDPLRLIEVQADHEAMVALAALVAAGFAPDRVVHVE